MAARQAATSALVTLLDGYVSTSATALTLATRNWNAHNNVSMFDEPTTLQVVQVTELVKILAQSENSLAVTTYVAAAAVNATLSLDPTLLVQLTTAHQIQTAGHKVALAIAIAGMFSARQEF